MSRDDILDTLKLLYCLDGFHTRGNITFDAATHSIIETLNNGLRSDDEDHGDGKYQLFAGYSEEEIRNTSHLKKNGGETSSKKGMGSVWF